MANSAPSTHAVHSDDGTSITYARSGTGPPILLVHGGGADASSFVLVARELARSHTVLLMDRRGRREPIEPSTYAIEREYEDLAAVAAKESEPVHVVAHSYGGLCALGATALRPERFDALTLYEPPIPTPEHPYATGEDLAEIEGLLNSGAPAEATLLFLRRLVKVPEHELELLRSIDPVWDAQVARAHVLRWEGSTVRDYRLDPAALARVRVPVTMILGACNAAHAPQYLASATRLNEVFPAMSTIVLPEQFHLAPVTAPAALARAIEDADRRSKG